MENAVIDRLTVDKPSKFLKQSQGGQIRTIGEKYGLDFPFIGIAPIPTEPVYVPGCWIIPAVQDQSKIPARTFERIRLLFGEGLRPRAFVIVHEAPLTLRSPQITIPKVPEIPVSPQRNVSVNQRASGSLLAGFLSGASLLSLPLLLLASVALIDPILIAITDEHEWIEIDRWNVEGK